MKKMTYIVLVSILSVFFAQDAQAENMLEILTPPQYISTQSNYLHIVGKTNAPLVEIFLNDEKQFELLVKDSIFHASLIFGYGVNEVRIIPIYSESKASDSFSKTVEIMYGPRISRKFKKIYAPYTFHAIQNNKDCSACHTTFSENVDSLTYDTGCLDCHSSLKDKMKKHIKSDVRTCITCHQQDSQFYGSSATEDTNLCYSCHTDKIGQFAQDFIHGPVAGGTCTICHDPHGSQFDHNLVNPEQILCFSCHEDLEEDTKDKRVTHDPFKNGQCGACHDPHATSNKWVLVKNSEEVCLGCHNPDNKSMDWHSHPYNVKPKRKLKINIELSKQGNLECISCHNPHATNSEHLLRINEEFTCIGCHTDVL